jgi:hypothetical protein
MNLMKIDVIRKIYSEESTIGELHIDGKYFCDTLEDKDRDLRQTDHLEIIQKIKVMGKTAIPKGIYSLIMDMSTRFGKIMPHILDVPGFQGIRIHAGNTAKDTEGCILCGTYGNDGTIIKSRVATDALYKILNQTTQKIIIEIK